MAGPLELRCVVRNGDVVAWTWFLLDRMDPIVGQVFATLPVSEQVNLAMKLFTGTMAELADDLARRCGFAGPSVFRVLSVPEESPTT